MYVLRVRVGVHEAVGHAVRDGARAAPAAGADGLRHHRLRLQPGAPPLPTLTYILPGFHITCPLYLMADTGLTDFQYFLYIFFQLKTHIFYYVCTLNKV